MIGKHNFFSLENGRSASPQKIQRELMGIRYEEAEIFHFSQEIRRECTRFLEESENFLVVTGKSGVGKTHLCSALIPSMISKYGSISSSNAFEICGIAPKEDEKWRSFFLESILSCEIVILEDIDRFLGDPVKEKILFQIIDYRYSALKPIILTAGCTLLEVPIIFDAKTSSRVLAKENSFIELKEYYR